MYTIEDLLYKSSQYCEITYPFPFYMKRISKQNMLLVLKKLRIFEFGNQIRMCNQRFTCCIILFTVNNIILLNACIYPHMSLCYVSECVYLVNSSLCVNESE